MTVLEIVKAYLKQHRFDGLFNPGECGCEIDDICPFNDNCFSDCEPGYKVATPGGEYDWMMCSAEERDRLTKEASDDA